MWCCVTEQIFMIMSSNRCYFLVCGFLAAMGATQQCQEWISITCFTWTRHSVTLTTPPHPSVKGKRDKSTVITPTHLGRVWLYSYLMYCWTRTRQWCWCPLPCFLFHLFYFHLDILEFLGSTSVSQLLRLIVR